MIQKRKINRTATCELRLPETYPLAEEDIEVLDRVLGSGNATVITDNEQVFEITGFEVTEKSPDQRQSHEVNQREEVKVNGPHTS